MFLQILEKLEIVMHNHSDFQVQGLLLRKMLAEACIVCTQQPQQQDANFTNGFLELFYDKYIAQLISVLSESCETKKAAADSGASGAKAAPSALALIVDLLCFCVQQHSYRIKCAPASDSHIAILAMHRSILSMQLNVGIQTLMTASSVVLGQ